MPSTAIAIQDEQFLINGELTYAEIPEAGPQVHGLLMNARFIQGIFDDRANPSRFARFGCATWDPEENTDRLIAALPEWHAHGLRAFTVGLQGGGPCFTIDNATIDNNLFGADGTEFDPAYAGRLDRLIRGADAVGMAVIVSYFYGSQACRIKDGKGIRAAVVNASRFLRDSGYTNVLIEVANENNIGSFDDHPIVQTGEGMSSLIDLARDESGGLPVGCSGGGGYAHPEICRASDFILIHGNGCTRQSYYDLIRRVRDWSPGKPVVCNEDSQAIGQLGVALNTRSSWGYYNNMTKQEPPADWSITPGEDSFFALRMCAMLGIEKNLPSFDDQYYLQGFESEMTCDGQRWIRLASLYPESIDYVEYLRNGEHACFAYAEPFSVGFQTNWRQRGTKITAADREWKAVVHLRDGRELKKVAEL
jgi:hypothetical protein